MLKKRIITGLLAAGFFHGLQAFAQHSFVFKSGEIKNGALVSINNGVVTYSSKGSNMVCNLSELKRIELEQGMPVVTSGTATPAPADEQTMNLGKFTLRYSMKGRNITNTPKVENMTEEKGTVIVDVTIDKYGNVISASPGAQGSTTNSKYLLTKAEQAAKSAKFDTSPTAPLKTSGTITVVF